jgi:toxin ParE1/3/4
MAEVLWSLTATDDLQDLEDFIARDSILYAIDFVDRIVEAGERLGQNPLLGRVVPEFGRSKLRELLFRGYRIVYLLKEDSVTILRVVHGARDLADLVRREPWQLEEE